MIRHCCRMQARAAEPRKFLKHAVCMHTQRIVSRLVARLLVTVWPLEPRKISYTYHHKLSESWDHVSHLIRLTAVTAFWPVFPTSPTSACSTEIALEHCHFEYSDPFSAEAISNTETVNMHQKGRTKLRNKVPRLVVKPIGPEA